MKKDNFDLRKFLAENKITPNARTLNVLSEGQKMDVKLGTDFEDELDEYFFDEEEPEDYDDTPESATYNPEDEYLDSIDANRDRIEEADDEEDLEYTDQDFDFDPEAEKIAALDAARAGEFGDDSADFEDDTETISGIEDDEESEDEKGLGYGRDGKWAEAALARALRVAQREADEFGMKKLYLCWKDGHYYTSRLQTGTVVAVLTANKEPDMVAEEEGKGKKKERDLRTLGWDTGRKSIFELGDIDYETGEILESPFDKIRNAETASEAKQVVLDVLDEHPDSFTPKQTQTIKDTLDTKKTLVGVQTYVAYMILSHVGLAVDPKLSPTYQRMKKAGYEKGDFKSPTDSASAKVRYLQVGERPKRR